jgi:hypothetical protein
VSDRQPTDAADDRRPRRATAVIKAILTMTVSLLTRVASIGTTGTAT